jgi:arabinogalactan oligomer/maltooligosaccharide transport system substrate-binding protein
MADRHLCHALVFLLLLGCAGCTRCDEPRPSARPGPEINLWHTFNPEETATLNRHLEQVRGRHPGWRIHPTVIPFARAQNKFRQGAQRCGKGSPHVFRAELPWVAELAEKGLILPVPAAAPAEGSYLPEARRAARYRGRRWILPASLDCLALFYNRALLQRPPADLAGLVELARRQTVDAAGRDATNPAFDPTKTVRWGFYVRADAYWFLPFLWAMGGELLGPEAAHPEVLIDRPEAVRALAFYRDLIRQHLAPPRPSPSNDYEEQMQLFGSGKLAMMVNGPWVTRALLDQPAFKSHPDRLDVGPFPAGPSGRPAAPLSGHGWVVSRCAPRPDAAWALAVSLSDLEAQATFAVENSLLPALTAVYADRRVRSNRFVSGFRAALARARSRPQHPAIARIFDDFNPAVQAVLLGDATPQEALAGVARAWRRLLGITGPASRPGPDAR